MIGAIVRLGRIALVLAATSYVADRLLARRAADAPPEPIRSLVVIDAPIERTWAVLADVERQPEWMHDLKAVRMTTPPPVGVGTEAEGTVRILGLTVTDPITITAFDPPHRFAIRHDGRYRGEGVIRLERNVDGSGTIVRWDETLVAPILPHLAERVSRPVFAAVFQQDLHNLRELVEA
jgi:uncharacterized protein YndB with AHSA1/START domain